MRRDFNSTGNFTKPKATHGSFSRPLADLAKSMFTHQEPYRDTEEGVLLYPYHPGNPPGENLAIFGNITWTMADHGNPSRPLEDLNHSPPAQGTTYRANEDNLPEGYLAVVTFGVTKEITASSQDPDQTSRITRPACRRLTRRYKEFTKEIHHLPHFTTNISPHHYLPYLPAPHYFTSPYLVTIYFPYSPPPHHFTNPSLHHHPNGYKIWRPISYLISLHHHNFTISSILVLTLQRLLPSINSPRIMLPIKPNG